MELFKEENIHDTNLILKSGIYHCNKCNGKKFNFASHIDFEEEYLSNYLCKKCGRVFYIRCDRNEIDRLFWGG